MEKLNIAELLKDYPSGMELNCTMYENLYFDSLNADYTYAINCYTLIDGIKSSINFTKYGTFNNHPGAKCVIYPKGNTTWEEFQRPFKDGDIITCTNSVCSFVSIFREICTDTTFWRYVSLTLDNEPQFSPKKSWADFKNPRLATKEEKQRLFDAIKANGYKWHAETKTLEKLIEPKFKVGDKIKKKGLDNIYAIEIAAVGQAIYMFKGGNFTYIESADKDYELVPNKFDITTLKAFDKVLVRSGSLSEWNTGIFSHTVKSNNKLYFIVNTQYWEQCIPYEGNEHLCGTTNDCDEYYKNW